MSDPLVAERSPSFVLVHRWVVANAVGELVGLGGVGLAAVWLLPLVRHHLPGSAAAALATAVLMVGLGSVEGAVVGVAQAWALAGTPIPARAWIRATVLGAMLAWAAGMVPSTVLALGGHAGDGPPPAGPTPSMRLLLAAGLGLVAGPVLGAVQLRVLRGHARRAWRWLLGCALGWALGMPLVFLAVRTLALGGPDPVAIAASAAALAVAGGLVGGVEGVFLARLLPAKERLPEPSNI